MKRLVSLFAFALVLFALGGLAYAALTGNGLAQAQIGPAIVAGQAGPEETAAEAAALEPAAPNVPTPRWNAIALPLDVGTMTADSIMTYVESFCPDADPCPAAVKKVSKWTGTSWTTRTRGVGFPGNYNVYPGMALLIQVDETLSTTTFAWAADVPPQCPAAGCIQYGAGNLPGLNQNGWSFIMIPLDKSGPATADALMADIGSVTKVSKWNGTAWTTRTQGVGFPGNYAVQPGYPYMVFATGRPTAIWPTTWP